jgi:uncharacterized protein YejL (UPF0352 family)
MSSIDDTLKGRGKDYGDYKDNVEAIAKIMKTLNEVHKHKTAEDLNLIDFTNLNYAVIKLVRLAATPDHIDSWHDLQGYAKLAEKYYKGE